MTTMEGDEGDLVLTTESRFETLSEFFEPSKKYKGLQWNVTRHAVQMAEQRL